MTRFITFLFVLLVIFGCAVKTDDGLSLKRYNKINAYLDEKDFFHARDTFNYYKLEIAKPQRLILEAFIDNAFNDPESSNKVIDEIFEKYADVVNDSVKLKLLEVQQGNYVHLYEYEKANQTVKEILENYSGILSKDEIDDYKNSQIIWNALSGQPKQEVIIQRNTTLAIKRDVAQLANLSVQANGIDTDFIFDTGANISTVTQSTAKKLNMKMLDGSVQVGAITGLTVQSQLAICPEFTLGDIIVKNAVFLVFPDEALAFPQINYQINGILGYPVIEAMKQITITQKEEFIVPKVPVQYPLRNMALDFLNPVICIEGEHYTFDSGAVGTSLYNRFFFKHRETIQGKYQETDLSFGGAGGTLSKRGYFITFEPEIEGRKIVLDSVQVFTENIGDKPNMYYGNIGQDVIKKFNKMTINFKYMYIKFD
ncbi:retropepsin-like aspartic protease [Flavobacterium alkalisoli]|uniref:retropepsin-like aspartic protease n=1 Tax=Flavobacterium alkalisoli TaxID=2602769 RepID=UPI003A8D9770